MVTAVGNEAEASSLDGSLYSGTLEVPRATVRARAAAVFDVMLEVGWLAAVVVVPLIFSPNLVMMFGVPKSSFLWGLAMAMAVVFLTRAAVVGIPRPADAGFSSADEAAHASGTGYLRGAWGGWRLPWSSTPAPAGAPLIAAGLTFGVVAALATLASVAMAVSWWGRYGSFSGMMTLCSLLVIFAIVATQLRSRRQVEWLVLAIVWASVPYLRFGAAQHWNFSPLPWAPDVVPSTVFSPAGDTITTGVYLAVIVPFTVYLAVAARAVEFRLIYALLALAQLAVLAVGGFLSSWLGVAGGLFVLALTLGWADGRPLARRLGGLGAIVVAVVTIAGLIFYARALDTTWHPTGWLKDVVSGARIHSAAWNYRQQVWQGAWNLGLQRPIVGWGPDTFQSTFGRTAPLALQSYAARGGQRAPQSYNLPLDLFQSSGVLGVLAWLATLVAFFGTAVALLRRTTSRDGRLIAAALVGGMVAYLITTLMTVPGLPGLLLFWVMLALAAALAGPLWNRLAEAPAAPATVAGDEAALDGDEGAEDAVTGEEPAVPEAGAAAAAPVVDAVAAAVPADGVPAEEPPVGAASGSLPRDTWRSLAALLAVGALALFLVPAAPLGLFWQSVEQVRADASSHDAQMAESSADYTKSSRQYTLAYLAAPFQPQYGLNAGRGILQNLANASPTPPKAAQLGLLRESEGDLQAAHRLDPWNMDVAEQLARLWGVWGSLVGQNRFADAQKLIQATENQHPNDVTLITNWAQTAQQLGRTDVTIQQYVRLGAAGGGNSAAQHLQAATTLSSLVDTLMQAQPPQLGLAQDAVTQALNEAHRVADLTPNDPGAAWLQIGALSYKKAQVVLTALGTNSPKSMQAVRQMLSDNQKALSLRPSDAATADNVIRAAIFLKDYKAAYQAGLISLKYHPSNTALRNFLKTLPASARK